MGIPTDQTPIAGGIESLGEANLRRVIDQAAIGMIVADPDGRGIYANARYCQMLGYTPEECVGMGMADFVHPDEDVNSEAVVAALRTGRLDGYEVERRWRRKDGSTLWGLVTVRTLREHENGPVTHFIIQILDIGARKFAEARLVEQERRFAYAVNAAKLGVWDWNPATDEVWSSPVGKAMLGLVGEEPGSGIKSWATVSHPDDWALVTEELRRVREGECDIYDVLSRWRHKAGHWIWIHARGQVVERDASSRPIHVMGTNMDVTELIQAQGQLTAANERLQLAISAGGAGTFDGSYLNDRYHWDERMYELYGLTPASFDGTLKTWLGYIHPDDRAQVEREIENAVERTLVFDTSFRIRLGGTGDDRHIQALARVRRRADGTPDRVIGMNWDITEHKYLQEALHEEKERLQITLHSIGDAVISTDLETRITYMNPTAEAITGWRLSEARERRLCEVFPTVDERGGVPLPNPVEECLKDMRPFHQEGDAVLLARDGSRIDIEDTATPVHASSGEVTGAVLVFRDTSTARALRRRLEYYANHDSLTGLPNRHAFERELRKTVAEAAENRQRHVLCFIDLDRFKAVNDSAGHAAGDALLCKVADLLRQHARACDLAARIGGDEFVLLLRDCDIAGAQVAAGQLADAIAGLEFKWDGKRYDAGASIGLTVIRDERFAPDDLMSQADAACYAAKASGHNRVMAYNEARGAARRYRRELHVISDIRNAMESGRFQLFAQEIQALDGGAPGKYFEILLRLREADGRMVLPGEFIMAAERYGLMGHLDRWVIRTLLREYGARLHDAGVSVAVNLSANSLNDPESWTFVQEELAAVPLLPKNLHLEITETALIDNLPAAVLFTQQARAAGCGITLDDFGTGMSSFAYLRQFAADTIKIDGSFIRQLIHNNVDRAIIESITAIARRLKAVTVAEHVEDAETLALVREIGIDYAQGHAIAYPVPVSEIVTRPPVSA